MWWHHCSAQKRKRCTHITPIQVLDPTKKKWKLKNTNNDNNHHCTLVILFCGAVMASRLWSRTCIWRVVIRSLTSRENVGGKSDWLLLSPMFISAEVPFSKVPIPHCSGLLCASLHFTSPCVDCVLRLYHYAHGINAKTEFPSQYFKRSTFIVHFILSPFLNEV